MGEDFEDRDPFTVLIEVKRSSRVKVKPQKQESAFDDDEVVEICVAPSNEESKSKKSSCRFAKSASKIIESTNKKSEKLKSKRNHRNMKDDSITEQTIHPSNLQVVKDTEVVQKSSSKKIDKKKSNQAKSKTKLSLSKKNKVSSEKTEASAANKNNKTGKYGTFHFIFYLI